MTQQAGPVQAEATRMTFTGHEAWGDPVGGAITSHEGMTLVQGATRVCKDTSDNPMGTGTNFVTANSRVDANGYGLFWGTTRFVTDEGGVWEFSWGGVNSATDFPWYGIGRGVGLYKGLLAIITLHLDGTVEWEILRAAD